MLLDPRDLLHSQDLHYFDNEWDTIAPRRRDEIVLSQALETATFARRFVPFYRHHLRQYSESDLTSIQSLEEYALTVPQTTREHLSLNPFDAFLPDVTISREEDGEQIYRNKGTGGSTGKPVTIIYSPEDWRAMAYHIARSVKYDFRDEPSRLQGVKLVGLYHGDHVTNEIYRTGLSLLGVLLHTRVSTKNDNAALYEFVQEVRPNGLLAPPEDPGGRQTKGSTLDAILALDARNWTRGAYRLNHLENPEFWSIFWSSMPMSERLQEYVFTSLGIQYQQAQYGSTEVCPTGSTCCVYPRDFHIGYGPSLVLLLNTRSGRLCRDGEEGSVLVSRTGGSLRDGRTIVPTGTILINYRTGDSATLMHSRESFCACGRTTPVMVGLHREEYVVAKSLFGCQAD